MPFIVGAGELPEEQMSTGALALSRFWGGDFAKLSCEKSPNDSISILERNDGIVQLVGDAAFANHDGGSWLESLGVWRIPTVLMVLASRNGSVPGVSSAYVALCKHLSVPLIGIIQLGGDWDPKRRSLDGLPWCGMISIQNPRAEEFDLSENSFNLISIEDVVANLKRKMISLNL
tara:strand:+ start:2662 stop:3186 length:525 start_codon:yes stop_codon:yes gene_type:complete